MSSRVRTSKPGCWDSMSRDVRPGRDSPRNTRGAVTYRVTPRNDDPRLRRHSGGRLAHARRLVIATIVDPAIVRLQTATVEVETGVGVGRGQTVCTLSGSLTTAVGSATPGTRLAVDLDVDRFRASCSPASPVSLWHRPEEAERRRVTDTAKGRRWADVRASSQFYERPRHICGRTDMPGRVG